MKSRGAKSRWRPRLSTAPRTPASKCEGGVPPSTTLSALAPPERPRAAPHRPYLTEKVFKVILQKSIPSQFRQIIFYISNSKGYVKKIVRKLTFSKRLYIVGELTF